MKVKKTERKSVVKSVGGGRMFDQCDWSGCTVKAGPSHFIHGKAYCPQHYHPALEKHFLEEFKAWDGKERPGRKFLNLFARYTEDLYFCRNQDIPGGLSKGRINDRIFDIKKTKFCVDFSIERHPYAWKNPLKMKEVRQDWRFNVKRKQLRLLREIVLWSPPKDGIEDDLEEYWDDFNGSL
jgi:hypothetical protein